MSALGLGTAQLGSPYGVSNRSGQPSEAEAAAILEYALESGIGVIDTAPAYGDAEALLGRLLPEAGVRIVTKTPPLACDELTTAACDAVRRSAESSLERLRRARLDALLVHHGSELALPGAERLAHCLLELRDAGIARQLGVSVYTHDDLVAARALLPLEVVQLPLNILDQRFLRDGTLEELHAEGVEVHVRSVFLQGLLLMKPEELPVRLTAAELPLRRFHEMRRQHGLSRIEAALAFVRERACVDVVVVGANSARELAECVSAMGMGLERGMDFAALAVEDPEVIDPRRWSA